MYASHASYGALGLGAGHRSSRRSRCRVGACARRAWSEDHRRRQRWHIAVLGTEEAEPLVREIAARYTSETGLLADVFVESGPGAEESGVLVIEANARDTP